MPGQGYIIESSPKPAQLASRAFIGAPTSPFGNKSCQQDKMLFPFYRKSFRSGSAYDIMGSKPENEVHMNEPTLYEGLLAISGTDVGHEYKKQEIHEVKSSYRCISGPNILGPLSYNFRPKTFFLPKYADSLNLGQVMQSMTDFSGDVSDFDLVTQGTRLFNTTNPLKPTVTLATSLTELVFEGLPAMIGTTMLKSSPKKREAIQQVGGEYLNFVFGVTPIWSDLVGIAKILRKGDEIVRQWQRNDGRRIRRRRAWEGTAPVQRWDNNLGTGSGYLAFDALVPQSNLDTNYSINSYGGYWSDGMNGYLESSLQTNIQYKFATSFEYTLSKLIPDYPEPIRKLLYEGASPEQIAEQLLIQHQFGLDPKTILSADTVWNTLPFSWLLDWFVNIGDLISNVTAIKQQGLVCNYGYMSAYIERRFTATYRFTHQGSVFDGTSAINGVYHRRIRSTPFGFGTSFNTLSGGQSAILAALATSLIR